MECSDFNVLICGKIRDIGEFKADIDLYLDWKSQGLIQRIVFSGWESDLFLHSGFINQLCDRGIEVVLSPDPSFTLHGYIFHQMKTLRYGLSRFRKRDRVFKSRTDKAMLETVDLPHLIQRFEAAPSPGPTSPFRHRVMILGGLLFQPYFFNDMLFAGEAGDLLRFCSFDLWFEMHNALINAEQAMHVTPWVARDPLLRDYFMANPGLVHDSLDNAISLQLSMLHDPFYRSILRRSLSALIDGYVIGFVDPAPWQPLEEPLTLEEVIRATPSSKIDGMGFMKIANALEFTRIEPIHVALGLPLGPDEPRNILQLTDAEPISTEGEIMCEPARAFAATVRAENPAIALAAATPFMAGNLLVYHGRAPLIHVAR
jgi:hypothetical protein